MHPDLPYMIALSKIKNIGPISAKSLIGYCGSAQAVFNENKRLLSRIPQIGPHTIELLKGKDPHLLASAELEFIDRHNIRIMSYRDSTYPERLKHIPESPIILYYKGHADLNATKMIGIVGTRKPSPYGLVQCERIVDGLAAYDVTIVSGLAYGIDACAHRKALDADLPTIGVLGHSFETLYPASHRSLAANMLIQGGLLTEFPSGTRMDKENFPMRNRIIAGMTDGLLVVESAVKGGSMISATFALAYHKDIFTIPGRLNDRLSAGCNHLIKNHKAALVESADDIGHALGWNKKDDTVPGMQKTLFEPLEPVEQHIVEAIRDHPRIHIDKLVASVRLTPGEIATNLLTLEFKGIVKSLPGKHYILV